MNIAVKLLALLFFMASLIPMESCVVVKPRASKTVLVKRGRPKYTKPARSTKMVKAKKPNRVRVIKKR